MLSKVKKGFTIIEVVIVLVIGAIIMLMVFLVVPQLQRSQRDSRRQQDARRFLAAVEQWSTNNSGKYPRTSGEIDDVVDNYIDPNSSSKGSGFKSPNGNLYKTNDLDGVAAGAAPSSVVTSTDEMIYRYAATCKGNAIIPQSGDNRVAVMVFQENGGSFCVSN
jgi:prepilin-type N-terminal cleavage/methylation domain-containing protein